MFMVRAKRNASTRVIQVWFKSKVDLWQDKSKSCSFHLHPATEIYKKNYYELFLIVSIHIIHLIHTLWFSNYQFDIDSIQLALKFLHYPKLHVFSSECFWLSFDFCQKVLNFNQFITFYIKNTNYVNFKFFWWWETNWSIIFSLRIPLRVYVHV